jgi:hypothetical protein
VSSTHAPHADACEPGEHVGVLSQTLLPAESFVQLHTGAPAGAEPALPPQ